MYILQMRLHLDEIVRETRYGLGSILHFKCENCTNENVISTGKRHSSTGGERSARCFDVNTKFAAAMLNAGVGELQVNNTLAELNIPSIHHKTLKQREREIGRCFEDIAKNSCNQDLTDEIRAINLLNAVDSENLVKPEVSTDGAWQRRGTGHNNNSLSGTGSCRELNLQPPTREVPEGTTYETGIGLENNVDDDMIEEIPAAPSASQTRLSDNNGDHSLIVFDLETTELGNDAHIIQLAAKHLR